MVGQIGYDREFGNFRIISWVNTDCFTTTNIVTFIIEDELGFPGHIQKKCLKKYDRMADEEIKKEFVFKGGTMEYPSEEHFSDAELDRNHFKQQIQDHKQEQ